MRSLDIRATLAPAVVMLIAASARADGAGSIPTALRETKLIVDLRLRAETVDQDGLAEDAHATTLRLRAGFETGKAWSTALLVEGEGVVPLQDDYRPDPMVPEMTAYPVVADGESYEVNRFQLTNTALPGTTVTLGRQRIALDDQRFVGPVGWRQNEQTFDALRVVNRSIKNLVLDATYFNQVNRLFGEDSPQGDYEGDSALLNASYQTPFGKVTGFGYLLDFDAIAGVPAALTDSTATIGLRFAGERPVGKVKVAYAASYATQTDYGDNPYDFDLGYVAAEITATVRQFSIGAGTEVLEGAVVQTAPTPVTKGFTTPLATLHKFQGWADKFLTTPGNGIEDRYASFGATFKAVGVLETLALFASFHDYRAERIEADFGDEWNLSLAAKHKRVNAMLKFADYRQGELPAARDTRKLWAQVEFVW
jgi:hypothetical protein